MDILIDPPDVCSEDICYAEDLSPPPVISTVRALLTEIRMIEIPAVEVYISTIQNAVKLSVEAISAWLTVVMLVFSPLSKLVWILARAAWPPTLRAASAFWTFQSSLSPSALYFEAVAIAVSLLLIWLRRFIIRRGLIPRARRSLGLFQARISRGYVSFTASVERNFRLSARVFPHVAYWTVVGLSIWLLPESMHFLRRKLWFWQIVTWPTLNALYLVLSIRDQKGSTRGNERAVESFTPVLVPLHARRSRSSPAERIIRYVDRALMYWVVFALSGCCGVLATYVPFAGSMIQAATPPPVRTAAFLLVTWMHLPGPGNGLKVVYATLKPVVHHFLKDLRSPDSAERILQGLKHILVFMRVFRDHEAQVIADNVADSWMLLPTPLCFFMPGFLTKLGCLYAGAVVPALNSIKTLGRPTQGDDLGGWRTGADPAGGARLRWLTYWGAYGVWWHLSLFLSGLLRVLPLSRHLELALLLWLQIPVFHGARRLLEFLPSLV